MQKNMMPKLKLKKIFSLFLVFSLLKIGSSLAANGSKNITDFNQRIVSTNLCIDSLVIALVGRKGVVAVSSVAGDSRYSLIAKEVAGIKKVNFNAEQVYSLKPTIVLASNFSSPKTRHAMSKLGLRVILVDYARSIDDIAKNLVHLGYLLNASGKAKDLIETLRNIEFSADKSQGLMAIQYSENRYVNGQNSLIRDVFQRSGFGEKNSLIQAQGGRFLPSEFVIKAKPDLLLLDENKNQQIHFQNPNYHSSLYKTLGSTMVTHIKQKYWSCGTPKIIDLIQQLLQHHAQILEAKKIAQ